MLSLVRRWLVYLDIPNMNTYKKLRVVKLIKNAILLHTIYSFQSSPFSGSSSDYPSLSLSLSLFLTMFKW